MKRRINDQYLTKEELRQRGWSSRQIYHLAPKFIDDNGIRKWKLSEIEEIESSIAFYLERNINES